MAQFAMEFIKDELWAHPRFGDDVEAALTETFRDCDSAMDERLGEAHLKSGTTAVVAVLVDDHLTVAHVGDSRAIVGTWDGDRLSAVALTRDQRPDLPLEQARILAAGGHVREKTPGSAARVYSDESRTKVGLAMSRTLGDKTLKMCGVVPVPEISKRTVSRDAFCVLATDGIWEMLTAEQVVGVLEGEGPPAAGEANATDAEYVCKQIIIEATALWEMEMDYRDDITCMVIKLNPLRLAEPSATYVPVTAVHKEDSVVVQGTGTSTSGVHVPRKQSILLDTVGDGCYDTLGVDTSGDGIADTFYPATAVDTNTTGAADSIAVMMDQPRRASHLADPRRLLEDRQHEASSAMVTALQNSASATEQTTAVKSLVSALDATMKDEQTRKPHTTCEREFREETRSETSARKLA